MLALHSLEVGPETFKNCELLSTRFIFNEEIAINKKVYKKNCDDSFASTRHEGAMVNHVYLQQNNLFSMIPKPE